MGSKSSIVFPTFIFIFIVIAQAEVFDITKFGAKPDAEISKLPLNYHGSSMGFLFQALCDAWSAACSATTPSKLLIPSGTFCLNVVEFKGPCKAPITVKIDGTLKGPEDPAVIPKGVQWITFSYVSALTITDSKMFHVNVMSCKNVTFDNFHICAPSESPNTDGIHLGWSKQITIKNSVIQTGDDCISIGDGCEELHIEGVKCGPGHGISVGSLGKNSGEKPVIGVYVVNCTFNQTMNGVRIKTWPDSHQGEVADLHFENLCMNQVENPIIKPSLVKVHDIFIKNVTGTATLPAVVNLKCSTANNGCENVKISDINLTYEGKEGPAFQECCNVKPVYSGKMIPPACSTADE
ncbi:Glycoside hydrolase, family 28 [Cynara cardunculus var. scolymus]|uniref:Glycoside hydrolase, family 28 n=1 Tax=Cynara cardunculus var. scolymus TaxID=59895 RepID=A0A103Y3Y9_CYNCS|nr:Glycoside hydrolase, family 28 [Cynara cardunculus var. scolymus]